MSNCHSTSRPSIPTVSAWDYGKQLKLRYDSSALAGDSSFSIPRVVVSFTSFNSSHFTYGYNSCKHAFKAYYVLL